jgi:hypothetical protein
MIIFVDEAPKCCECVTAPFRDGSSGKSNEAGVRQGPPHIGGKGIVLAPVCFVHENEDILFISEEGEFFRCILEFLDGGHDHVARGSAENLFKAFDASCIDRVRESAMTENSVYLVVKVSPVRDNDNGRILQRFFPPEFHRRAEHGMAFSAPLPVPDKAPFTGLPGAAFHDLVGCLVLLVLGNLFDDFT